MSTEGQDHSNQSELDQARGIPPKISSVLSEQTLPNLMREPTPEEIASEQEWFARYASGSKRSSREELLREFMDGESPRYGHCNLDGFVATDPRQKAAVTAIREYVDGLKGNASMPPGLLFYGPCGTGKDHLAIAVCREAIERHGMVCKRINGSEWFGEVRDQIDEKKTSEAVIVARLSAPEFLLISDPLPPFGPLTQFQATMLYRIVEKRYFYGKPTIVTVNVKDGAEGEDRMGAATWDRLKDGVWVIACNWPSHRRPARIINGVKSA